MSSAIRSERRRPPTVLLYVFDSLRADHLGCYGFEKDTSPSVDALARDGVLYERAYSTAGWTKPAAASILSGRQPRSVHMRLQMNAMPRGVPTVQSLMKQAGYWTCAVTANAYLSREFGFDGFEEWQVLQQEPEVVARRRRARLECPQEDEILRVLGIDKPVVPQSDDLNERALLLLQTAAGKEMFLVVWSADTHAPYYVRGARSHFGNSKEDFIIAKDANEGNLEKVKSLYCDMVRFNDENLGKLLAALKAKGLYDESLIIVVSDHGEALGEHIVGAKPRIGHGGMVYEEVVRVPMVIKYPRGERAGTRVTEPVQLTDVAPTIGDVCRLEPLEGCEGMSLRSGSEGLSKRRTIFIESQTKPETGYSSAVIRWPWKLIEKQRGRKASTGRSGIRGLLRSFLRPLPQTNKIALYNLESDPKEQRDLAGVEKAAKRQLLRELKTCRQACDEKARGLAVRQAERLDTRVRENLRALGYLE